MAKPSVMSREVELPTVCPPEQDAVCSGGLDVMLAAVEEVETCIRALERGGLNLVGELLKGQGTFYEFDHYPKGDVFDPDSHAQYYYHAHRGMLGEHGHFHTFMRAAGMPADCRPARIGDARGRPSGDEALSHIIGVSMDPAGYPIGLFATNGWVTGETWYGAKDVIAMLPRFDIDHAYPSWPTNRWLSAMVRVFEPEIRALLEHRDAVVAAWAARFPSRDVLEDRELDITGSLPISLERTAKRIRALANAQA